MSLGKTDHHGNYWRMYVSTNEGGAWTELSMEGGVWDFGPKTDVLGADMSVDIEWRTAFDGANTYNETTWFGIDKGTTPWFRGIVKNFSKERASRGDLWTFHCEGLFAIEEKTTWLKSGSARFVYNVGDPEDPDYDSDLEDKTVGDIIDDMHTDCSLIWTYFTDDPANLTQDACPDLTVKPQKFAVNGGFVPNVLQALLSQYMPYYKTFWEYSTGGSGWALVIVDTRSELTEVKINRDDMDETPLESRFNFSRDGVFSAVEMQGAKAQTEVLENYTPAGGGDITEDWDVSFEAGWSEALALEFPETYGKVYRCFELSQNNVLPTRLSSSVNNTAWIEIDGIWEGLTLEYIEQATGKFRTKRVVADTSTSPVTQLNMKVRYAYQGSVISSRFPSSGYSGPAWEQTGSGLEAIKYEIDEQYKKITMSGVTTGTSGSGMVLDYFLAATPGKLANEQATLTYGGSVYDITSNYHKWIFGAGLGNTASGQAYTVTWLDLEADLDALAEALHSEVSGRNFTAPIPIAHSDVTKFKMGIKLNFFGWNNAAWETIDGVVVRIETDVWMDSTRMDISSLSNLGVAGEFARLRELRWNHDQTEENEIQIGRLQAAAGSKGAEGEGGGLSEHDHRGPSSGGFLIPDKTRMDDGTDQAIIAVSFNTDKYYAEWDPN
jgi:hypothetical protein